MIRNEFVQWWKAIGGEYASRVTKKTDMVIVGENPGERKISDALRRGVPALPYQTLDLVLYHWRRKDPLVKIPNSATKELNVLWLELFDNVLAHYLLTGDERLGELVAITQRTVEGLLQITRGHAVEGPCGEELDPESADHPADLVSLVLQGTTVIAQELERLAKEGVGWTDQS